jgi:hypothetical protein
VIARPIFWYLIAFFIHALPGPPPLACHDPVLTDLLAPSLFCVGCGRRSCLLLGRSWRRLKRCWFAQCLSGGSTLKITFNTPGWAGTPGQQDIHIFANKFPLPHYKNSVLLHVQPLSHFVLFWVKFAVQVLPVMVKGTIFCPLSVPWWHGVFPSVTRDLYISFKDLMNSHASILHQSWPNK